MGSDPDENHVSYANGRDLPRRHAGRPEPCEADFRHPVKGRERHEHVRPEPDHERGRQRKWDVRRQLRHLRVLDFSAFRQTCNTGNYDACTTLFPFDQPNPNSIAAIGVGPAPPQDNNWTRAVTPEADGAFAATVASVGAERCKQWSIVQQSLLCTWSILPTASPNVYWFSKGIEFFPGASRSDPRFFRRATS
jgi:hypothetical protein